MFIDVVPNRSSPPAVLLRESYREGGRVKKRTLANLSQLPQPLIDGIAALIKGGKVAAPPGEGLEIRRSLPHGHAAAVLGQARRLGLDRLLLGRTGEPRKRDLALAMIVQRVLAPGSKLATWQALRPDVAASSLPVLLGLGEVAEREVYAALDWLGGQQPRIEQGLARRHLHDGTLVLYDVSSSYLEGRCCELAQFGYSRDHRRDRPQIVYGLLCAADGCPVAVEVFSGETSDPKTLAAQVDRLKRRFKLAHVVLVGDRGLITSARIREELEPAGLDWITALRAPAIRALADDGPLQLSLFDERDLAEISSPDYPGERLIVCRNPALAEERRRKRNALLAATEDALARVADQVRRGRLKDAGAIGVRVGAVLGRHKMAKHFTVDIADGRCAWARDTASIEAEARLDGLYVIRTSVPAERLDAPATVGAYKTLARVERAFRSLKAVDLQVRPVHHWLAPRVRAHVFLCMLAYYVEFHLRAAWAPLLFADHAPEDRPRASVVASAEPSPAAAAKRGRRRTDDGLPVMGFRDLLRQLATLTLNTVALPLRGDRTFTLTARPTALQQKAFDLLGIPPPCVQ